MLLADISGYTAYLQGTELEHAQDVLADLLETIIAEIEPPFTVSKLEGDAVFAYMPEDDLDVSRLFDVVDATYFAFRRRLRDVVHSTTCDCNACVLIPSLDLKFLVHSGEYVIRRIGRSEELTGSDVVLVHRLLKGTASEVVGGDAYLTVTKDGLDAVGGDPKALGLIEHTEALDVGGVIVYIENLEDRWKAHQESFAGVVTPETALGVYSGEVPLTPQEMWDWVTVPSKRLLWQVGLTEVREDVDGRRGVGTVNHCAHGGSSTLQEVLDWHPFSTFTTRDKTDGLDAVLTVTMVLTRSDGGSLVTYLFRSEPEEAWEHFGSMILSGFEPARLQLLDVLAGEDSAGSYDPVASTR
jgi:hypothetical protein